MIAKGGHTNSSYYLKDYGSGLLGSVFYQDSAFDPGANPTPVLAWSRSRLRQFE